MHGELLQGDTSVFFWKTKQLYMHGTLASIEKAAECCPRAFLLSSSSSFELHAVLTLWNMNFRVTCHCFLLLTICYLKKHLLKEESSIYDLGQCWAACERMDISSAVKKILKDKWQMASTSPKISTKILLKNHTLSVGSNDDNYADQKCKPRWLSRHHQHYHLLFIVLHMSERVAIVILVIWTRQALDVFSGSTNPHLPLIKYMRFRSPKLH